LLAINFASSPEPNNNGAGGEFTASPDFLRLTISYA